MKFHEYRDEYSRFLQQHKLKSKDCPPATVYDRMLADGTIAKLVLAEREDADWFATKNLMLCLSEIDWINSNRPYYRIYPEYAEIFSCTELDIPLRHLMAPYRNFCIRLAEGAEFSIHGFKIGAVLFTFCQLKDMLGDLREGFERKASQDGKDLRLEQWWMCFRYHVVVPSGHRQNVGLLAAWPDQEDVLNMTLDDYMHRRFGTVPQSNPNWKMRMDVGEPDPESIKLLRLALAVAFLGAGNDRLIERDVLHADFNLYLDAVNRKDATKVQQLHDKAVKKRGEIGFTVGREEALLGRRSSGARLDQELGDGKELKYQHQRKGHIHKYWYGPGKSKLKMQWTKQVTVRPDRPLNPNKVRGVKTLESKEQELDILTRPDR